MTQDEQKRWNELENRVSVCRGCALSETRKNTVFGRGDPTAPLLFVGEAPGEQEDKEGKPFVGPAGKLLDDYIAFLGLEEKDYYIANILKCRPPRNRDPLPQEEEVCMPYLREQVKLIAPRAIVCLGRIAAQRIISPDFRITKDHGKWFEAGGMQIMATFHPSALLRDPQKKILALDDFKSILEKISFK